MITVLDYLWRLFYTGEEAKPWHEAVYRNGKKIPAKEAIHYTPATFEKLVAEFMDIKPPKFGDFITNKANNDPDRTANMQGMAIDKWAELRTGAINISECQLFPIKPGKFLGPIMAYEIIPYDPHQYIGCATVMVKLHLPPICVIMTHNVCPLHESHSDEDNERYRGLFAQSLLKAENETPGCLTKWDEQALMMMARLKENAEQRALLVKARGL